MFIVDTNRQDELFTSLFGSGGLVFTREIVLEAVDALWLFSALSDDADGRRAGQQKLAVSMRIADWIERLQQANGSTIHLLWPLAADVRLRQCVRVRHRKHQSADEQSLLFEMDDGMRAVFEDGEVRSEVVQDSVVWTLKHHRTRRKERM